MFDGSPRTLAVKQAKHKTTTMRPFRGSFLVLSEARERGIAIRGDSFLVFFSTPPRTIHHLLASLYIRAAGPSSGACQATLRLLGVLISTFLQKRSNPNHHTSKH